ncbi:MAG: hypothetical protein IE923_07590 [Micrococcales bacterium]|nr:hypothetical protein [Micrococcales bacterium]
MTVNDPPWDRIDLEEAARLGLAEADTPGVVARARTADGSSSITLTTDAQTGWHALVLSDLSAARVTVAALLDPDEARVRLSGSIAPRPSEGPRVHYAVARTTEHLEVRVGSEDGHWEVGAASTVSGWALTCLRAEEFLDPVRTEISTPDGRWEPFSEH